MIPSVSQSGSIDHRVGASCNAPFEMKIRSEHGALALDSDEKARGFRTEIPYTLNASLPLDNGEIVTISDCSSQQLLNDATCSGASSEGATAIDQHLDMSISWVRGQKPLLAGRYKDTLRVTLEPMR